MTSRKSERQLMETKISITTESILAEIADKRLKQKDIAQSYLLCMISEPETKVDWPRINRAILSRWSISGLKNIKKLAHSGKCFPPRE